MAKLLFIVNEHPNEAFSISAARETAKMLKQTGNEIVWYKVPFKETVLGKRMTNPKMNISEKNFTEDLKNSYERIERLAKKHKPDHVLNFHTTPHDNPFWKGKGGKTRGDFAISTSGRYSGKVLTIEVKAHYKSMPKRHLKKLNFITPKKTNYYDYKQYLTETTSQKLTRQDGLIPKAFGKAIAKRIQEHIKTGKPYQFIERGNIRKNAKKAKIRKARRK